MQGKTLMANRTIYATVAYPDRKDMRLSFVESEGMVHVYSKTNSYGGFLLGRFGTGDKLNRAWIREFAGEDSTVTF
jgi:hypothetical protein